MKFYVYILLLLTITALSGCRSHRSVSEISEKDTQLHITEQSSSNTTIKETTNSIVDKTSESSSQENKQSVSETAENKQVDEFEEKEEIKEEFDENGKLKSRTTTNTSRKRLERSDSRTGTHDASSRSESSLDNEQSQETKKTDINQQTEDRSDLELVDNENINKNEDTSSDSRWIQGLEWLYAIIPIAIIAAIVYLLKRRKK